MKISFKERKIYDKWCYQYVKNAKFAIRPKIDNLKSSKENDSLEKMGGAWAEQSCNHISKAEESRWHFEVKIRK